VNSGGDLDAMQRATAFLNRRTLELCGELDTLRALKDAVRKQHRHFLGGRHGCDVCFWLANTDGAVRRRGETA
jgi:hypothetical protein